MIYESTVSDNCTTGRHKNGRSVDDRINTGFPAGVNSASNENVQGSDWDEATSLNVPGYRPRIIGRILISRVDDITSN